MTSSHQICSSECRVPSCSSRETQVLYCMYMYALCQLCAHLVVITYEPTCILRILLIVHVGVVHVLMDSWWCMKKHTCRMAKQPLKYFEEGFKPTAMPFHWLYCHCWALSDSSIMKSQSGSYILALCLSFCFHTSLLALSSHKETAGTAAALETLNLHKCTKWMFVHIIPCIHILCSAKFSRV